MGAAGEKNCISLLCALPGRYALGTWWLSNMMYLGCLEGRNSQFGHVTTRKLVVLSHFCPFIGVHWGRIRLDFRHQVAESGLDDPEDLL